MGFICHSVSQNEGTHPSPQKWLTLVGHEQGLGVLDFENICGLKAMETLSNTRPHKKVQ